jgi:hypothetical protein
VDQAFRRHQNGNLQKITHLHLLSFSLSKNKEEAGRETLKHLAFFSLSLFLSVDANGTPNLCDSVGSIVQVFNSIIN